MAALSCILFLKSTFNMTCMDEKNQIVVSWRSKKNMVNIEEQCDYAIVCDFKI